MNATTPIRHLLPANHNINMRTFLRKSNFFAIAFAIANLFFVSSAFSQATVTTDALDYPPGATAIITGTGFQPGEQVKLQVLHNPTCCDDSTSLDHQPWYVTA